MPVSDQDVALGPATAAVTLTLFCDFQCPYCRQMTSAIQAVMEKYPSDIRFVFKHYPLPFHPAAHFAAEAFQAAAAKGKAWQLHDAMFNGQATLTRETILSMAGTIGLDPVALAAEVDARTYAALVDGDIAQGEAVGVEGTPSLFINGRSTEGRTLSELVPLIDEELAAAKELREKGVTDIYAARTAKGKTQQAFEEPVYSFDLSDAPVDGTGDGTITLVLFSDFQCPYCSKFREPLKGLLAKYPKEARLYFKHFPLQMHDNAHKAAEAGVAAQLAGKFWAMHDLMFDHARDLEEKNLVEYGQQAGLDSAQLAEELKSEKHKARVDKDVEEGRKVGVRGTPTLFVNGRKYVGASRTADAIAREIDKNILGR